MSVEVMPHQKRLELYGKGILSVLAGGVLFAAVSFQPENVDAQLNAQQLEADTPELTQSFSVATSAFTSSLQKQVQKIREERRQALIKKWSAMPHTALTPAQELAIVTPEIRAAWEPQHQCENSWDFWGHTYSGGLGIMNDNWIAYGGQDFAQSANLASPIEQIAVGRRIQEDAGIKDVVPAGPDEKGVCHGW